jgi:hypothetical protein
LKVLKDTDVYSAKFKEIEKLEDAINLLQHQCNEVITEEIEKEQKRLNGMRDQLSLAVAAKMQMEENLSISIRSMEGKIKTLEGRFRNPPVKGDAVTCGDDDLEAQTDGRFPCSAIAFQEYEELGLLPPNTTGR